MTREELRQELMEDSTEYCCYCGGEKTTFQCCRGKPLRDLCSNGGLRTGGLFRLRNGEPMNLEKYGYSSITGVCFNPFGVKPREIQEAAAKLRHHILVDDTEEALF
jgi:hypothetical protein